MLADAIVPLLPRGSEIVDVGCGDGALAALIRERGHHLTIEGYDVLIRPHTNIAVGAFDGKHLPLENASVDFALLIDVLHHTSDPMVLLREAVRVSRQGIIIKDHRMSRPDAGITLRIMDWVGNRPSKVALPYNYWSERRWREAWTCLGLAVRHYQTKLGLYQWPASWIFEKGLHFVAKLTPTTAA